MELSFLSPEPDIHQKEALVRDLLAKACENRYDTYCVDFSMIPFRETDTFEEAWKATQLQVSCQSGTSYFSYKNCSGSTTLKSFARSRKLSGVMVCSLSGRTDSIFTRISADFSTVCARPKVISKSGPAQKMP